jgi:hypothetical protein
MISATSHLRWPGSAGVVRRRLGLQAKLEIHDSGDAFEREADRVADQVTSMPDTGRTPSRFTYSFARVPVEAAPGSIQRAEEEREEDRGSERWPDEPLQLKREAPPAPTPETSLAEGLGRSSGSRLPAATRSYMEPRFGHDFSHVRIHTGPLAHGMSVAIGAAAFTWRNDIFFRNGRFAPETASGRHLLAHELTHVVQQESGKVRGGAEGRIQRAAEVHVNLRGTDRVKVYRDSGATLGGANGFLASSGKPGHRTELGDLSITRKRPDPTARLANWGLRYFATFHGAQGFHSHITWPTRRKMCSEFGSYCTPATQLGRRVRYELTVDGSERSHGCVRLHEDDAHTVFDAVAQGTPVKIYREAGFRPSPFPSSGGGGSGGGSSGRRTHRVVSGDTLSELAVHYDVSIDALRSANGIPADSSHIEIGQELIIPDR